MATDRLVATEEEREAARRRIESAVTDEAYRLFGRVSALRGLRPRDVRGQASADVVVVAAGSDPVLMPEKTKYHVLIFVRPEIVSDDPTHQAKPETWAIAARDVEAHSATDAIRQTVKTDGLYVAVPSRSFTPTTVKLETTTVVKIGAATG